MKGSVSKLISMNLQIQNNRKIYVGDRSRLIRLVFFFKDYCNYLVGSIPRGVLACFLPKSRDIQDKMPSPKVI